LDLYSKVYLPLSSSVLPEIENNCLTDNKRKACVYPTYVMEGQANGRLSALKVGRNSYNPHSIGPEEKSNLKPAGYDEAFVCFDYRNMEVNVLQWLSKDSELGDILKTDKDIYKEIWRRMTRIEPTDSHRSICKKIFLPVVFGLGRRTLAGKLGSSEEFAARLIDNFVDTFPVAFDWVKNQSADGNNVATDIFGRRRKFKPEQMYKIRNFVIQSPASMICLRKLVRLHEALSECGRIAFHIHDGYSLLCKRSEINSVFELGTRVLEDEEDLFPGLRLRTTCQVGSNLGSLEKINTGVVKA
jgi:DNA polymerase-1